MYEEIVLYVYVHVSAHKTFDEYRWNLLWDVCARSLQADYILIDICELEG
jgi:hypothetical protein